MSRFLFHISTQTDFLPLPLAVTISHSLCKILVRRASGKRVFILNLAQEIDAGRLFNDNVAKWHHSLETVNSSLLPKVEQMTSNNIEQTEEALQLLDPVLLAVTSQDENARGGLIATFVSNLSIVPDCPRLMVGISRHHHTWELIENSNCCALHFLGENQLDWAWKLGTCSGRDRDKLSDFETTTWVTGAPVLVKAIAAFDCKVEARFETGDRTVYLLEVVQARKLKEATPMKFSDLWAKADQKQRKLMQDLLEADQQIDREAIQRWRKQCR